MVVDNLEVYNRYYSNLLRDKRDSIAARYINCLYSELLKCIDVAKITKVVDIGCGDGSKTYNLLHLFPNASITGIDFSAPGINFATQNFHDKRLSYVCCDASTSKKFLEGGAFITCSYVLEHLSNWEEVLLSWKEAKVPWVMLCAPIGHMWGKDRREHYLHFKNGLLEKTFLKNGYEIIKKFHWGFPFYHPMTQIALNINARATRKFTTQNPSFFQRKVENLLYFLYTHLTSRKVGGDIFALFYNASFDIY